MARYKLIVLSNAADNRDDEYNDWYDNTHLRDVLAMDGIVAAQRFRLRGGGQWNYLAIYEMDCADPEAVLTHMQGVAGTDAMVISDAFDMGSVMMGVAEPIGPVREG